MRSLVVHPNAISLAVSRRSAFPAFRFDCSAQSRRHCGAQKFTMTARLVLPATDRSFNPNESPAEENRTRSATSGTGLCTTSVCGRTPRPQSPGCRYSSGAIAHKGSGSANARRRSRRAPRGCAQSIRLAHCTIGTARRSGCSITIQMSRLSRSSRRPIHRWHIANPMDSCLSTASMGSSSLLGHRGTAYRRRISACSPDSDKPTTFIPSEIVLWTTAKSASKASAIRPISTAERPAWHW